MRLYQPVVEHLALVDKPCAKSALLSFRKAEGEVFASFMKFQKMNGKGIVEGLAYNPPFVADSVGDFATAEDLRAMAKTFDENGRKLNLQHKQDLPRDRAEVIESKIQPDGSWAVTSQIHDPQIMQAIRDGRLLGYSVGGRCAATKREEDCKTNDELAIVHQRERQELVEMCAVTKSLLNQLDDTLQIQQAMRLGAALLEDASSPQEVAEAIAYLEQLVSTLERGGLL